MGAHRTVLTKCDVMCDDTEFVTLGDRDRGVTVLKVLLVERDFHRK